MNINRWSNSIKQANFKDILKCDVFTYPKTWSPIKWVINTPQYNTLVNSPSQVLYIFMLKMHQHALMCWYKMAFFWCNHPLLGNEATNLFQTKFILGNVCALLWKVFNTVENIMITIRTIGYYLYCTDYTPPPPTLMNTLPNTEGTPNSTDVILPRYWLYPSQHWTPFTILMHGIPAQY